MVKFIVGVSCYFLSMNKNLKGMGFLVIVSFVERFNVFILSTNKKLKGMGFLLLFHLWREKGS
jgi:hypothetical protein